MSLLFSNVAEEYVTHSTDKETNLSSQVNDLFDVIEDRVSEDASGMLPQQRFITSVASQYYQQSIEDINNEGLGNKAVRRKNFQQIMKESFFYGANRYGNNFIAQESEQKIKEVIKLQHMDRDKLLGKF